MTQLILPFLCEVYLLIQKDPKVLSLSGGGRLSVRLLCEKNCLIFKQQAEFFLISCLVVAKCFLFGAYPAYKGVFLLKRCRQFFFSHLTFFYEHVNICIVIVYKTVLKTLIFYVEFTKKKNFFFYSPPPPPPRPSQPPNFLFEISVTSVVELFLRGGSTLKRTYIEAEEKEGGGGVKNWKFRANILFEWSLSFAWDLSLKKLWGFMFLAGFTSGTA